MNILILGSGGRESALACKISQSRQTERLYVAPGNAGTLQWAENVALDPLNFAQVKEFILENGIGMLVVGPEEPLVKGIHDYFLADADFRDLIIIGPCRQGAQLEGSKQFAKDFMARAGIPTARYSAFTQAQAEEACRYLETLDPPYVLKADGLAAGKGVLIETDLQQAKTALRGMLEEGMFGAASKKVVIEEYLQGTELSVFVLTDGRQYKILPEAKDYKKIGEGETGLNTGGMGSISPVPFADRTFMQKVEDRIIRPTLRQLEKEHIPYSGFLFIGLMNVAGDPYVIEYNVRMGDPETEAVMPRIASDMVDLLRAVHEKCLDRISLEVRPETAACVMTVSGGYPGSYKKGFPIVFRGEMAEDTFCFHAGTAVDEQGRMVTAGGRVLAVTTLASTLQDALRKTYAEVAKVEFPDKYYRKDIGQDLCR